jgi:hypothetical protein
MKTLSNYYDISINVGILFHAAFYFAMIDLEKVMYFQFAPMISDFLLITSNRIKIK